MKVLTGFCRRWRVGNIHASLATTQIFVHVSEKRIVSVFYPEDGASIMFLLNAGIYV